MEIYISASRYRSEMFLYSKRSYGYQFSKEYSLSVLLDEYCQSNRAKTHLHFYWDTQYIFLLWKRLCQYLIFLQGVLIKIRLDFCSITLPILLCKGLDYILWKTDIHSFVLNTETFLSDIWKPRYRFPKFQFQNW